MRTPGIYIITNTINNKKYIGSTNRLERRWSDHKWLLKNNKHTNQHLQASYAQYGPDVFHFRRLEECPIEQLTEREEYWIRYFEALDPSKGYNIQSPQAKEVTHERQAYRSQPIGNYLDIYNSETLELLHTVTFPQASIITGVSKKSIWKVLREETRSHSGFIFRRRGGPKPVEKRQGVGGGAASLQISIEGILYPSVQEATLAHGVTIRTIYDWVAQGRHQAYYPSKASEPKPLQLRKASNSRLIQMNHGETTQTIHQITQTTGIPKQKIYDVLSGRRKSYKGFTFQYAPEETEEVQKSPADHSTRLRKDVTKRKPRAARRI